MQMEPGTAALRNYLAPPGEGRRPERFPCRCGRAPAGSGLWRQAGWPPLRPVPALTSRILERLRGGGCPRPGRAGQPARTAPCGAAARLRRRAAAGSAHAHTHRRRQAGGGGTARGTQRRSPPSPLASPRRGQPAPRPPAGDLAVYLRQVNPSKALPLRVPLRNPARRGAAAGRTEGRAGGQTRERGARPRSASPPGRRLPGRGRRSYSGAAGGGAMRAAPGALRRSSRGAGRCGGAGRGARCPRLAPPRLLLRPFSAPPAAAWPRPQAAAPLAAAWREPPPPPRRAVPCRAGAGWRSRAPPRPAARTAEPQPGHRADVSPGRPPPRRARSSAPPGGTGHGQRHGHRHGRSSACPAAPEPCCGGGSRGAPVPAPLSAGSPAGQRCWAAAAAARGPANRCSPAWCARALT